MKQRVTIRGPILSVSSFDEHRGFFRDSLGMEEQPGTRFESDAIKALLGADNVALETTYFVRRPTEYGVRLWRFDPPHGETIRDPDRGTDRDALKVVDFYAPDFDHGIEALRASGYPPKPEIADYELPEGRFREAHLWRPDNIVCAVISGSPELLKGFVTVSDRTFSEPQSISAPVSDLPGVIDFYRDVFGFDELYKYQINNDTFDALVGTDHDLNLTAINVGTELKSPYLGLIDYGQAKTYGVSLKGRSRPPARGLVGVELEVANIGAVLKAAAKTNAVVLVEPTVTDYPPLGPVVSCLIEGPHGVLHHVVECR